MKTLKGLIRKVDEISIKKTGHRLTENEIDIIKDTYSALGISERPARKRSSAVYSTQQPHVGERK
jgi:hypothetical protein